MPSDGIWQILISFRNRSGRTIHMDMISIEDADGNTELDIIVEPHDGALALQNSEIDYNTSMIYDISGNCLSLTNSNKNDSKSQ